MYKLGILILAAISLSGCLATNSYYPRAYGEDWKVYPFVEGYATEVTNQGRACWDESNRENWRFCE